MNKHEKNLCVLVQKNVGFPIKSQLWRWLQIRLPKDLSYLISPNSHGEYDSDHNSSFDVRGCGVIMLRQGYRLAADLPMLVSSNRRLRWAIMFNIGFGSWIWKCAITFAEGCWITTLLLPCYGTWYILHVDSERRKKTSCSTIDIFFLLILTLLFFCSFEFLTLGYFSRENHITIGCVLNTSYENCSLRLPRNSESGHSTMCLNIPRRHDFFFNPCSCLTGLASGCTLNHNLCWDR